MRSAEKRPSVLLKRFEAKYIPEPNSGCWLWIGGITGKGYGAFNNAICNGAHRFSYTVFKGSIPAGMFVLHRCDIPGCVNPDHLTVGTPRENTQDCILKGRAHFQNPDHRFVSGERCNFSKLKERDVVEIRRLSCSMTAKELALKFAISVRAIHDILSGNTWRRSAALR